MNFESLRKIQFFEIDDKIIFMGYFIIMIINEDFFCQYGNIVKEKTIVDPIEK